MLLSIYFQQKPFLDVKRNKMVFTTNDLMKKETGNFRLKYRKILEFKEEYINY